MKNTAHELLADSQREYAVKFGLPIATIAGLILFTSLYFSLRTDPATYRFPHLHISKSYKIPLMNKMYSDTPDHATNTAKLLTTNPKIKTPSLICS